MLWKKTDRGMTSVGLSICLGEYTWLQKIGNLRLACFSFWIRNIIVFDHCNAQWLCKQKPWKMHAITVLLKRIQFSSPVRFLGGPGMFRRTSLASWDFLMMTPFSFRAVCMRLTLDWFLIEQMEKNYLFIFKMTLMWLLTEMNVWQHQHLKLLSLCCSLMFFSLKLKYLDYYGVLVLLWLCDEIQKRLPTSIKPATHKWKQARVLDHYH